jgi:hypothetical protein
MLMMLMMLVLLLMMMVKGWLQTPGLLAVGP